MLNGYSHRVNLIWQIAEFLRGDYKQSEYGKVVLPLVVLRRLDCVLAGTKTAVLGEAAKLEGQVTRLDPILTRVAGVPFYNTSPWDFEKLLGDPENLATNLRKYIGGFSEGAAEVLSRFGFDEQIGRLDKAGLLYLVVGKFAEVDLHPNVVKNHEMGAIYEELIRKFSEQSNETAGEHFTPREVIRLMVELLLAPDAEDLSRGAVRRTLYDPTCGTGGMLSVAEDFLSEMNPDARLEVFGQELNDETYAICRSDMMLKGQDPSHIAVGNTLTKDAFPQATFDYCLSNPPFGVDWKKVEKEVRDDVDRLGSKSRFAAGLPRVTDGQLLFMQHMVSKMKEPEDGGTRLAVVLNGSPLFSGDAGSGESEIRRWLIENDWLDAVIALPDQLFYNTGIWTYVWVVSNRKPAARRGKVQLIDGRALSAKLRRSVGEKRKELTPAHIGEILTTYADFAPSATSKIVLNSDLGFLRVVVEEPLRDEKGTVVLAKGRPVPDPDRRDVESIPLPSRVVAYDQGVAERLELPEYLDAIERHLEKEIRPYAPEAWLDLKKSKIGYEVAMTRLFYRYVPPRSVREIDDEILALEADIAGFFRGLIGAP